MTHTPGPWKIQDGFICSNGKPVIWAIGSNGAFGFLEASNEDAQLIATAPELLEACKELIVGLFDTDIIRKKCVEEPFNSKLVALRDAIAKAEGREVRA